MKKNKKNKSELTYIKTIPIEHVAVLAISILLIIIEKEKNKNIDL